MRKITIWKPLENKGEKEGEKNLTAEERCVKVHRKINKKKEKEEKQKKNRKKIVKRNAI